MPDPRLPTIGSTVGRITLVGAGPGGADLITVRGARALGSADVVLYDRLADPELLALAPPRARLIPVGKSPGDGVPQDHIEALIIEHAAAGRHVVRLKGGDPFLFGRGAEECAAAHYAGIPVDVVPGISSSLAAPALAGIPVTHRDHASNVMVVTARRTDGSPPDWAAIARAADTIVVLMGVGSADRTARALIDAGRHVDEPVAVIHRAGHADQAEHRFTLGDMAADGCPLPSPSTIVIGAVAEQRLNRPVAFEAAPIGVAGPTSSQSPVTVVRHPLREALSRASKRTRRSRTTDNAETRARSTEPHA